MLSNPPDAGGTKKKAEPDVEEEPKAKKTKKSEYMLFLFYVHEFKAVFVIIFRYNR